MRLLVLAFLSCCRVCAVHAQGSPEPEIRRTIEAFYQAFNAHDFHLSPYVTPDGTRHDGERQIRTFVLVKQGVRWRIIQDHNTIVGR